MLIARCQPRIRLFKGCVQLYAVVCSCIQLCAVVFSCVQLCSVFSMTHYLHYKCNFVHTVRINNVPKQCVRLL